MNTLYFVHKGNNWIVKTSSHLTVLHYGKWNLFYQTFISFPQKQEFSKNELPCTFVYKYSKIKFRNQVTIKTIKTQG